MQISFTIPGRISGKGRPRFAKRGAFMQAYTPEKTRNTEAMMRAFAAEAMAGKPIFDGPIFLSMLITLNPPASWSKKKRAAALFVTGKPDPDNLVKMVDSLNGVVWRDDAQICDLHFSRRYSLTAREEVVITVVDAEVTA